VKLHVSPLSRLQETLATSGSRRLLTMLSDGSGFRRPESIDEAGFLQLTFHDITEPREGHVAPSPDHVRQMLAFAAGTPNGGALLIHCYAGISRSTAAAYAIACAARPDRSEADIAMELRRLSPSATPNALIIAHADAQLGRHGRMVEAIRSIGRGAEAFEGECFRLDL
jgi:predicted protein tyrosine phosphatase